MNDGGFNAVPFSYGNTDESTEQRIADAESGFRPPFSLPESLLQNLVSIYLADFFIYIVIFCVINI